MATIAFLLNGTPQRCDVSPDTSILTLLREHLAQTGTKEGCASGDCGACTVAISEPTSGTHRYTSANACITPAHQLQGRHLVTVEGLSEQGHLHPAQEAMIECHGSQCGFCTPGIVMSLFTLHSDLIQRPSPLTPERLEAALGGNLCRCTGYRPIRDAALSMNATPYLRPQWFDATLPDSESDAQITDLAETAVFFAQPTSLVALAQLRQAFPQARLVAGGTDLWLESTQRLAPLDQLIDVSRVAELLTIEEALFENQTGWWIGAGVTYTQLEPLFNAHFPAFAHLLHRLGSQQIRNRGTLGGNIANASPIGDTPPVLLALDTQVELASVTGKRCLALEDFFLDYKKTALATDEVVSRIFIPQAAEESQLRVWKLSKRREDDISALLGAFCYRVEQGVMRDVRIAFGGMAATPKRALAAEAALEGSAITPEAFRAAQQALEDDFQPMSDVRGSQHYRQQAAQNLIERLYLSLSVPDQEVMLHAYAH
ncbi:MULTISPECIES: xanthine dehydrogenase small subunit [unclassified Halomonas]|uniref:xanthine dehydrogenase small subunit n=1 Tax=unclassified Halomonas TaxID=2609666 RepID=UPI0005539BCB|nr:MULTISPECIES: xanthine dehydrogenase small subunit [unclassified Halomonas]MBR9904512.1 xanthine dehydrogenase small subunit [Gammaproteobacteria bacterium]CEP35965.1 Xanthine dehydrogenase [Halomonas sp. R57-5]